MKKKNFKGLLSSSLFNIKLKLNLTAILFLFAIFTSQANNYITSTKISLHFENASIKDVLEKIEADTEFRFLYRDKNIDLNRKVTIQIDNKTIEVVLNELFKNSKTTFAVYDNRQVRLMPKEKMISKSDDSVDYKTVQKEVSGSVKDSDGIPVPGVSVVIKGTNRGVATDFDGMFTIEADADDVLVFSSIGYANYEVLVGNQNNIEVVMKVEASSLDEVVVVGYGTQRKSDLTGAVGVLSNEDLLQAPVNNSL